jgi:hypothetical protein
MRRRGGQRGRVVALWSCFCGFGLYRMISRAMGVLVSCLLAAFVLVTHATRAHDITGFSLPEDTGVPKASHEA